MTDRFLIVDGSNLLFQMFYGMPARIVNKHGKPIHGTLGFTGALLKIIRRTEPTHIAVLFDGEHENARSTLDADYKANRTNYSSDEESPFSQLPDIYAALDHLKIKYDETQVCEADDWIAGYTLTYGGKADIIIVSSDSDLFQLITDRVSVLKYRGERTVVYTPQDIKNKFGISPMQYADFKSLVGDNSDNIKGAEKVGPKTAAYLLDRFATLDDILKNADKIERQSVRDSIARNADRLRRNYKLIRLGNCEPLPFDLGSLTYSFTGETTVEVLKAVGIGY